MAPNKRKMLEAARKYAQKGSKDRALKEYEALLKLDPKDAKLRLELADALRRWGQLEPAASAYRRVAEQYTAEGFDARAVAVYKQIQSLDPKGYEACEPLADLYQRMGLASEAVVALQAAADGHARDGNKRRALELLRRMAALDPANTTSRLKVADLLRQEKLLDEAAAEYEAVCGELERQGELEPAGRVIERLAELRPDDVTVLCRLARNLLARGRTDEAEAPARRAAERDPHELAHHELLAEVYRAQKRDDRLAETYRRIAELYRTRGDEERAREIIQRFVPVQAFSAPAAPPAPAFGAEPLELDERGLNADERGLDPSLLDDELLADDELLDEAEPAPRPPTPAARPAARVARPAVPAAPRRPEPEPSEREPLELGAAEGSRIVSDVEQLLAEASVYLRYGKRAQAIENLQAILGRDPGHRAALEKLGDAYADGGDRAGAVAAWLRAAELARDDGDRETMGLLRDRIAALDAIAAATLEPEEELPLPPGADAAEPDPFLELPDEGFDTASLEASEPADAIDASAPGQDAGEGIEIDLDLDGVALGEGFEEEAAAPAPPPDGGAPELEADDAGALGIEFEVELGDDEPAVETGRTAADFTSGLGSEAGDEAEGPADGGDETEGLAGGGDGGGEDPTEAEGALDVGEALEEAEFYLQQGLASDARAIFERVLARSPGHPLALVRLGEIAAAAGEDPDAADGAGAPAGEPARAVAPPFAAEPAPELAPDADPEPETLDDGERGEPDVLDAEAGSRFDRAAPGLERLAAPTESFDLAAELSAAFGEEAPGAAPAVPDEGLAAIFGAFKRGVEQALGSGDHEAHYDLGIAYREMGLLEDASAEFRSAMASPSRYIDSLHMLGLCALDLGRADEAVDCLAHALASPDLAQEQELAIRFELGRAYERAGEPAKARAAWEKVAAVDPSFCEVAEMLAMLDERAAQPPAAPAPSAPEPAVAYESFGDLIAEAEEPAEAPAAPAAHESFEDLAAEPEPERPELPEPSGGARRSPPPEPARAPERPRRRKISFV